MSSRWLSVQEIADHLGCSRDTVYRWIEDRKLPAHRIGRFWKACRAIALQGDGGFKLEEVDEWVRAGKAAEEAGDDARGTA